MRADPRGALDPGEAVGREGAVERLWQVLGERSLILQARGGLGKSTLVRMVIAEAPAPWRGCRIACGELASVEALPIAIVEALGAAPAEPGPRLRDVIAAARASGRLPASSQADTIALLREAIAAELADAPETTGGLLLALDDIDRFLAGHESRGLELAELIASLDELLHEQPRLRLLLVSNAKLRRAVERIRPRPLAQSPLAMLGELRTIMLEPLGAEAGARLAAMLLLGESITARDRPGLARKLSDAVDHVPRWIHAVAFELGKSRTPVGEGRLDELLARVLVDASDPWGMRADLALVLHVYAEPTRRIAISILDRIAQAGAAGLSFAALHGQFAVETTLDADALRRVLDELHGDQLTEESGGQLRFAATLLRRTWVVLRKLEAG
jgi:hypothetical protein